MSIKNSLNQDVPECQLDNRFEVSGHTRDVCEDYADEEVFIRECEDMRVFSLSAHSEAVDKSGMIEVADWGGEDQEGTCFATRKLEWGVLFMDRDIKRRIVGIAKRRPKSSAGLMAKKAAVEAYLAACEDSNDYLVQLARGLCDNLV